MMDELGESGWHSLLTTGQMDRRSVHPFARGFSQLFRLFPGDHRCKMCHGPFDGSGAKFAMALGVRPSSFSMQLCGRCEVRARGEKTGAYVPIATLFADVRGSTRLANELGPEKYRDFIDRFYTASTEILIEREAIIEQLVGDQVAAIFVPGLAGENYVERSIETALEMQRRFGAGRDQEAWASVGIGIDAGDAFVGVVGTMGGMTELTVLGDVPNRTARLADAALSGEVVVTELALESAGNRWQPTDRRPIDAKGFDEPVDVAVLNV